MSPPWKQDVFVSFGEKDKGETFILNLFKRLRQVGIGHFGDDKREGAGKNNEAKRLNEIRQPPFAFALFVFSKNYVNSIPCLNELVEILCCQKKPELVVIPIFYGDRADVSNLASNDNFKKALERKEKKQSDDAQKKLSALAKAGYNLKAVKGDVPVILARERNLIDKIIGRLVNEIHCRYSSKDFTFGPFGGEGQNDGERFNVEKIEQIHKKGIKVEYGAFIKSVKFEVDENTDTKPQDDGMSTFEVRLKDGEYLTSFAGSKNANEEGMIDSLTFRTNKRILGPIGREKEEDKTKTEEDEEKRKEEEYFSVPLDAGKVTEFFWSKKGNCLKFVGAKVELDPKEFNFLPVWLFGSKTERCWNFKFMETYVGQINVHIGKKKEQPASRKSSGKQFILSIEFEYGEKKEKKWSSSPHLSNTGQDVMCHPVKLYAGEYLTSMSGYYTDIRSGYNRDFDITSLTFRTNKHMAIGFGEEEGIYFSSSATAGKIVGIYGCNDEHQHLCGIGAYFGPISDLHPNKSIGPSGGSSGDTWDCRNSVRQITVNRGINIDHIKFEYDDGSHQDYPITDGGYAATKPLVTLDYPREYLTSISGYVGEKDGAIKSLTFYSNKKRVPIGDESKGKYYFWYPSAGSRIIGLHRSEVPNYIRVHVEPIPHLYPFKTVRPPMIGSGGEPWDDGVHTNVRGFRVTTSGDGQKKKIESITFMYDDNGSLVEGDRHGEEEASSGEWVLLDFPKDRLRSIEGYMRKEDGQTIICDLRIVPTKGNYRRYAPRKGKDKDHEYKHFVIPKKDGRIVGFFGTAKTHLNSIGARLEPY